MEEPEVPSSFSILKDSIKEANDKLYDELRQHIPSIEAHGDSGSDSEESVELVFSGIDHSALAAMEKPAREAWQAPTSPQVVKQAEDGRACVSSVAEARREFKLQQQQQQQPIKSPHPRQAGPQLQEPAAPLFQKVTSPPASATAASGGKAPPGGSQEVSKRELLVEELEEDEEEEEEEDEERVKRRDFHSSSWFVGAAGRLASDGPLREKYSGENWAENIPDLPPTSTQDNQHLHEHRDTVLEVESLMAEVVEREGVEGAFESHPAVLSSNLDQTKAPLEVDSHLMGINLDDLLSRLQAPGGLVLSDTFDPDAEEKTEDDIDIIMSSPPPVRPESHTSQASGFLQSAKENVAPGKSRNHPAVWRSEPVSSTEPLLDPQQQAPLLASHHQQRVVENAKEGLEGGLKAEKDLGGYGRGTRKTRGKMEDTTRPPVGAPAGAGGGSGNEDSTERLAEEWSPGVRTGNALRKQVEEKWKEQAASRVVADGGGAATSKAPVRASRAYYSSGSENDSDIEDEMTTWQELRRSRKTASGPQPPYSMPETRKVLEFKSLEPPSVAAPPPLPSPPVVPSDKADQSPADLLDLIFPPGPHKSSKSNTAHLNQLQEDDEDAEGVERMVSSGSSDPGPLEGEDPGPGEMVVRYEDDEETAQEKEERRLAVERIVMEAEEKQQELLSAITRVTQGLRPPQKPAPAPVPEPEAEEQQQAQEPEVQGVEEEEEEEDSDDDEWWVDKTPEPKKEAEVPEVSGLSRSAHLSAAERKAAMAAAEERDSIRQAQIDKRTKELMERQQKKKEEQKKTQQAVRSDSATMQMQVGAWERAIASAAPPGCSLFHPQVSFTPALEPLPTGACGATPGADSLFTLIARLPHAAALPDFISWALTQTVQARKTSDASVPYPAFRVWSMWTTWIARPVENKEAEELEEEAVPVVHLVASADVDRTLAKTIAGGGKDGDKERDGRGMLWSMSLAIDRGELPDAATGGGSGHLQAELFHSSVLPSQAPLVAGTLEGSQASSFDSQAETTLLCLAAPLGAAHQPLTQLLNRVQSEGWGRVVGLRAVCLSLSERQALVSSSPHRPPAASGELSVVVALRGREVISRCHTLAPPLATSSISAQTASKELALFFGGRVGSTALPSRGNTTASASAGGVLPSTGLGCSGPHLVWHWGVQRTWLALHPALTLTAAARVVCRLAEAGLTLLQMVRGWPPALTSDAGWDNLGEATSSSSSPSSCLLLRVECEGAVALVRALLPQLTLAAQTEAPGVRQSGSQPALVYMPQTKTKQKYLQAWLQSSGCARPPNVAESAQALAPWSSHTSSHVTSLQSSSQTDPPLDVHQTTCLLLHTHNMSMLGLAIHALAAGSEGDQSEDSAEAEVVGMRVLPPLSFAQAAGFKLRSPFTRPPNSPLLALLLHGPGALIHARKLLLNGASQQGVGPSAQSSLGSLLVAASSSTLAARMQVAELFRPEDLCWSRRCEKTDEIRPPVPTGGLSLQSYLLAGPPQQEALVFLPRPSVAGPANSGSSSSCHLASLALHVLVRVALHGGCQLVGLKVCQLASLKEVAAATGLSEDLLLGPSADGARAHAQAGPSSTYVVACFRRQNAIGLLTDSLEKIKMNHNLHIVRSHSATSLLCGYLFASQMTKSPDSSLGQWSRKSGVPIELPQYLDPEAGSLLSSPPSSPSSGPSSDGLWQASCVMMAMPEMEEDEEENESKGHERLVADTSVADLLQGLHEDGFVLSNAALLHLSSAQARELTQMGKLPPGMLQPSGNAHRGKVESDSVGRVLVCAVSRQNAVSRLAMMLSGSSSVTSNQTGNRLLRMQQALRRCTCSQSSAAAMKQLGYMFDELH